MTALAADRRAPYRESLDHGCPAKAAAKIYSRSLVFLDASGWAAPATAAVSLFCAGVAQENVDNSAGANGDKTLRARRRGFCTIVNGDTIVQADIGKLAWAIDDQTVAKGATGRSLVGTIVEVESDGAWVDIMPTSPPAAVNADTSGLTLGNMEIEVNELKAVLRTQAIVNNTWRSSVRGAWPAMRYSPWRSSSFSPGNQGSGFATSWSIVPTSVSWSIAYLRPRLGLSCLAVGISVFCGKPSSSAARPFRGESSASPRAATCSSSSTRHHFARRGRSRVQSGPGAPSALG